MLRTDRYPRVCFVCNPLSGIRRTYGFILSSSQQYLPLWRYFIFFLLLLPCIARSSLWKLRYLLFHVRGIEQTQSLFYFVNNHSNASTCPRCRRLRNCLGANKTCERLPHYHVWPTTSIFKQRISFDTSMLPHLLPCRHLHLRLHQPLLRQHRPSAPSSQIV